MNNKQLGASLFFILLLLIGCFYWGKGSQNKKTKALIVEKDDEILSLKLDIERLKFSPPHNFNPGQHS